MAKANQRRYALDPTDPRMGYYVMIGDEEGWRWHWFEGGMEYDVSVVYPSRAESLRAAADDAQDNVSDVNGGSLLARRLRQAASFADKVD
jgi:hypothetical protein